MEVPVFKPCHKGARRSTLLHLSQLQGPHADPLDWGPVKQRLEDLKELIEARQWLAKGRLLRLRHFIEVVEEDPGKFEEAGREATHRSYVGELQGEVLSHQVGVDLLE